MELLFCSMYKLTIAIAMTTAPQDYDHTVLLFYSTLLLSFLMLL